MRLRNGLERRDVAGYRFPGFAPPGVASSPAASTLQSLPSVGAFTATGRMLNGTST